MRFGLFDSIIHWLPRYFRQGPALFGPHGNAEADRLGHLGLLLNPLIAGFAIGHSRLSVQEISGWGEVMHIGGGGLHRMDEKRVIVDANMELDPNVPFAALLGLVHLWILSPSLALG